MAKKKRKSTAKQKQGPAKKLKADGPYAKASLARLKDVVQLRPLVAGMSVAVATSTTPFKTVLEYEPAAPIMAPHCAHILAKHKQATVSAKVAYSLTAMQQFLGAANLPQQEPQPQLVLEQPLPPPPLPVHPLHAVNMTEQLLTAYAADEDFASTVDQYDQDKHGLYRTKGKNQIVVPNCQTAQSQGIGGDA
ncbi:hypothetical protein QJQ45_011600 [Haematococcus lacustris]|nr:hypothetical protein QJQ45_011600 [Haematococcus lacustris]